MLSLNEIENEINDMLENSSISRNHSLIADLIIIHDYIDKDGNSETGNHYSKSNPSESIFYEYASSLSRDEILRIFDEHMSNLKILMPSVYEKVLNEVKSVKSNL